MTLDPRLDVLPEAQRTLWPDPLDTRALYRDVPFLEQATVLKEEVDLPPMASVSDRLD